VSEPVLSEPGVLSPALPSAQDAFLNQVRRERAALAIRLLDGAELRCRVKAFDRFSLVVEVGGVEQLVFKHAIATVARAAGTSLHEARA
jgi:host factor-I protein